MIRSFETVEEFESYKRDTPAEEQADDVTVGVKLTTKRAVLEQPCKTFGTYSPVTFTVRVAEEAKGLGCSRSALIREFMEMGMEYANRHPKAFERRIDAVKRKLARRTGIES